MTFRLFIKATLFAALVSSATAQDKLKIATVNMQELFNQYYRKQEVEQQIKEESSRVKKDNDERQVRIREIQTSLESLKKQIEDPAVNDSKKKELVASFQSQQQEGISLERERQEFLQRRDQAIRERLNQQIKEITEEIRKIVQDYAKSDNFDYVMDHSSLSLMQTPVFLYSKEAADITPIILKDLNKNAPAKPTEKKEEQAVEKK